MAKKQNAQTIETAEILLGHLTIPAGLLPTLAAESYAKTGVILQNERINFVLMHGDVPVKYTASCYVQRDAINDTEALEVAKVKELRESNAAAKEAKETERQAREKKAAFELGQESQITAMKNIGVLAAGVRALDKLARD